MAVYAERTDTPESSVFLLDHEQHTATERINQDTFGWTREVEADLVMSPETAKSIRDWLDQRLKQIAETDATGMTFTTSPSSEAQL